MRCQHIVAAIVGLALVVPAAGAIAQSTTDKNQSGKTNTTESTTAKDPKATGRLSSYPVDPISAKDPKAPASTTGDASKKTSDVSKTKPGTDFRYDGSSRAVDPKAPASGQAPKAGDKSTTPPPARGKGPAPGADKGARGREGSTPPPQRGGAENGRGQH